MAREAPGAGASLVCRLRWQLRILPDLVVRLTGTDGNAFAVLGLMKTAFEEAGHADRWEEFKGEATSGDYYTLLAACIKWADVS